ncbi:hypothetical protein ACHAWF_000201 [Thalassiosira exigua]
MFRTLTPVRLTACLISPAAIAILLRVGPDLLRPTRSKLRPEPKPELCPDQHDGDNDPSTTRCRRTGSASYKKKTVIRSVLAAVLQRVATAPRARTAPALDD